MSDNNNQNNSEDENVPMPSFSGMPDFSGGISINVDEEEVGEETTRRIGGGGFTPSFEPVQFGAPQTFSLGPSINTAPQKTAVQTAPSTQSKTAWKLTDATVLPEFHPLERTAVFVPFSTPAEVARRVSNVLRERSIQAVFDNVKAKAKCLTQENVDFRVFMYRGQRQYAHGIIVEVQRRFGNSVNFYKDTQAILDAAENKKVAPPSKAPEGLPPAPEDSSHDVSESSLDFVAKMLKHQGYDAQYLALQTLTSLTDSSKMGNNTAVGVAKVLLSPGNEVGASVFNMIVNKNNEDTYGLRLMAMTVLSNVIVSSKGQISPPMQALLRPVMIDELKNADTNPQMAYLVAKGMEPLVSYGADDDEMYSALRTALEVGEEKHAGLREQADKCLQNMER